MVSNDSEGVPQIPARPTSVVVDSEDEDVPPPIPVSRPVPAPPADDIMEDDEEDDERRACNYVIKPTSPVSPPSYSVPTSSTKVPLLPKSPPPVAPIAVAYRSNGRRYSCRKCIHQVADRRRFP